MHHARPFFVLALTLTAACAGPDASVTSLGPLAAEGSRAMQSDVPDGAHIMRTVPDAERVRAARGASVQATPITYHGGPVLRVTKVAAIYWGSTPVFAGGPTPGTSGPGSADGSIVGDFLRNLAGSPFWRINNAYTDQFGGRVGVGLKYTQFWAASPGPAARVSDFLIRSQIAAGLTNGNLTFDQQTVYTVFSGPGVNLGGGFGSAYCAYHYFFTWGTKQVAYAVIPWAQEFPGVCTRLQGSPNGDFGADAVVTPIAHEVVEAATDPGITSWYDANKDENADKCVWTFGSTYVAPNGATANVKLGTRHYLVQQNWKIPAQACGMS